MLSTDRVVLRPWQQQDVAALMAMRNDVALQALLMSRATPHTLERTEAWLADRSSREDMAFFVIASTESGCTIGYIQAASIDRFHGRGDLGICLDWPFQGQGLAQEICQVFEDYLRDIVGLRKLFLRVLAKNTRAVAFYARHGYRHVGTLTRDYRDEVGFHDVVLMERLFTK